MKKIIFLATLFISTITSNAQVVSTFSGSGVAGSLNGTGTSAQLNNPSGICKDNLGNFYVADTNNNKIRKITSAGVVITFAGSGVSGSTDGTGTTAQFNLPTGVCVDVSGNVYVADKNNNKIRKITSTGVVTTFAGSSLGYLDGIGTAAKFNLPTGVCIDNQGNIYVADSNNNKIRKITTTGVVTTLAGSGVSGYADGAGTVAQFNLPTGVCADVSGNIYVADKMNNRVREVSSTGLVTTIVSYISLPTGICADNTGNVYVSDQNYHKIAQINPSGALTYLVGSGTAAYADGFGSLARFNLPFGICTDTYGNVYVADSGNNRVRKILICNSANSPIITITPSTTASVCPGQNVILSTTGVTSYTSFSWNSGQTTSTISVNPTMSYSYSLTATNAIGCSTASLVVTVIPNNFVVVSGSNTTCLGQNVTLTASGVSSYSWNNGSTSSSITVNPTNVTTYTVTGTDACGFVSTNSFEVNVINTNPTIAIQQPSCSNLLGSLSVASPRSNISNIPLTPYISEVTDEATGALTYIEIFNGTGNIIDLSNYKLKAYYNGGTTPTWNFPLSGNLANNSVFVVSIGSTTNIGGIVPNLFLTYSGVNTNDNIRLTTINDVEIDLWGRTDGIDFTPSNQPGYVYRRRPNAPVPSLVWNPADWTAIDQEDYSDVGTFKSLIFYEYSVDNGPWQSSTQFNGLAIGNHNISVRETAYQGCSAASTTSSFTIDNPIPIITIASIPALNCSNQNITLTASGGDSYLWSNGASGSSAVFAPTTTTTYSVIGTDANGCSAIASKTVNVYPTTTATISADGVVATATTITNGSSVQLQLNGTLNAQPNIQWTPAIGISSATVANPVVYPSATTTYTASFINSNGCPQTTSFTVNVTPQPNIGNLSISSPTATTIGLFDTITIDVQLTNATNLYSLYMKLKGNAAVSQYLDYSGYTAGTLLGTNVISTPPTVTNGVPDFGITKVGAVPGYSGSGLFYSFRFVPKNITIPAGTTFCFYLDDVSSFNASGTPCGLTNQGQFCYTFTNQVAVWPGDLNKSNTVTTADLLPIGYFYNSTGPARPNATIQWTAQPATLWGYNRTNQNSDAYKVFADSNGDGVINNADQAAIGFNMNRVHSRPSSAPNTWSASSDFSAQQLSAAVGTLTVTPNNTILDGAALPQTITFTVNLNNTGGLNALYGISVNLVFDETVFDLTTTTVNYAGSIFGNVGSDCLALNYNSDNTVSVGLTRFGNAAINGQGLLFKVTIQTRSTLPNLSVTPVTAFVESANNQTGDTLVVQEAPTSNFTIVNNLGIDTIKQDEFVLYPNPASDVLYLQMGANTQLTGMKVKVVNLLGQVIEEQPIQNNTTELSTKNWGASGVYFVQIINPQGQIVEIKKIILQ